jgi:hypothetical protein
MVTNSVIVILQGHHRSLRLKVLFAVVLGALGSAALYLLLASQILDNLVFTGLVLLIWLGVFVYLKGPVLTINTAANLFTYTHGLTWRKWALEQLAPIVVENGAAVVTNRTSVARIELEQEDFVTPLGVFFERLNTAIASKEDEMVENLCGLELPGVRVIRLRNARTLSGLSVVIGFLVLALLGFGVYYFFKSL